MRKIKFRAKCSGHWWYGDYVHTGANPSFPFNRDFTDHILYVDNTGIHFIPITDINTIGQFTSLYDNKGNRIYEGDILRFGNSPSGVCEVKWNETIAAFCIRFYYENELGSRPLGEWLKCEKNIAIIGNIHDNPELLKGGEE